MIAAVPTKAAAALKRKAYYFVPLTVTQGDEILIADRYDVALSDNAVCHRNLHLGDSQCVFISTRLMDDKFSVAFEFYINVGHALVEEAGVSKEFSELAWKQVEAGTRGETSLDAWEARKLALAGGPDAERFKNEYFEATFADTISIYLAVSISRRGLLRSAGAGLSAAGAFGAGGAVAKSGGAVSGECWV